MTHKPTDATRATVSALVSFGVPQEEIGSFMDISDDTLRKYYSAELKRASVERNAAVASFLFRSASGATLSQGASYSDCLKAAFFWLKTRANWRETQHVELTGAQGGPIQTVDLSKVSTEALLELSKAIADAATTDNDGGRRLN